MDFPTLLLQLENQLQSLHKKGFDYLNIEAMPKVELRKLLEGLGELVVSQTKLQMKSRQIFFLFQHKQSLQQTFNMKIQVTGYFQHQQVLQIFKK